MSSDNFAFDIAIDRRSVMRDRIRGALVALVLAAGACAEDDDGQGSGSLGISLDAEDTIIDGIPAGEDVEDILDGWRVDFARYIAAIGPITITRITDQDVERVAPETYVVDLAALDAQGLPLWTLDDLSASEWQLSFETPGAADAEPMRHDSVNEADFEALVDDNATYLIEGTLSKNDGVSCPPESLAEPGDASAIGMNNGGDPCYENPSVSFTLLAAAETVYGPCEADGMEGFSVTEGGTTNVALTIHGDHVFFNGFPQGDEGGIMRLAQWLADCDLDLDGEVTRAELERIAPSDLAELDHRYDLTIPFDELDPVEDMWTYIRAQLKTQGHFQGEGECAVDGVEHSHEEEGHDEHDEEEHQDDA